MNKKGFTLIELLAVIALLAILVIIALPNIMGLFNEAKKNSFMNEAREIIKVSSQQWISDSMFNSDERVYSKCKDGCSNSLKLSGREDIEYYIKLDKSGKIVEYAVTDGTYQYTYSGSGLNIDEINEVEQISELSDLDKVSITPSGLEYEPIEPSLFTYTVSDNKATITGINIDSIKRLEIPSEIDNYQVVSIGNLSFMEKQIATVIIPEGVTSIGNFAFRNNKLTSVKIPDSVTSIAYGAFRDNQLKSIIIPEHVTTIGSSAFQNNKLTSVSIPNSVTSIDTNAFNSNMLPDDQAFIYKRTDTNKDGIAEIDNTTVISYGGAKRENVVIPNNVVTLERNSFYEIQLKSITIPSSVKTLKNYVFQNNQLASVVIPNSVTSMGIGVFDNNKLTSLTISNSITSISNLAFYRNELTSVTIPSNVSTIGANAFASNKLTSVTIPSKVTKINSNAFLNNQLTSVTIVGKSSSSSFTTYQPAWGWASDVTCVTNNTENVENGCITWN